MKSCFFGALLLLTAKANGTPPTVKPVPNKPSPVPIPGITAKANGTPPTVKPVPKPSPVPIVAGKKVTTDKVVNASLKNSLQHVNHKHEGCKMFSEEGNLFDFNSLKN